MPAAKTAMAVVSAALLLASGDARTDLADRVGALTRESAWRLAATIPVSFRTFHPQGMVRVGDDFFVSSVEVKDRAAGLGVGHLFRIDRSGRLLAETALGESSLYHPGGIDCDGTQIWVPVAEYRPDSRSIVYRVDPATLKATEVFRVDDHIGAIVHNTDDRTLHGVSWGSRRFYRWTMNGTDARVTDNPAHYVDYQDCKYAGGGRMICTGVTEMRSRPDGPPFRLGGIELIDLRESRPLHQVPLMLWTRGGLDMTHNPVWLEATPTGIRGYFMPDDDRSTIYVYDVDVP